MKKPQRTLYCFTLFVTIILAASCSKTPPPNPPQNVTGANADLGYIKHDMPRKAEGKPEHSGIVINAAEIAWTDLLPDADLHALENPPAAINEIEDGSEFDRPASPLKAKTFDSSNLPDSSTVEGRYALALSSKNIRPEFNGRAVRIPGFIVPLDYDDHQTITSFFIVPFFGACLHLPPPPPNQIIYATFPKGLQLEALYDPFWIEGVMSTTLIENDVATAAYSMAVLSYEPYSEDAPEQDDDPLL